MNRSKIFAFLKDNKNIDSIADGFIFMQKGNGMLKRQCENKTVNIVSGFAIVKLNH
jgi:hypothetical protein